LNAVKAFNQSRKKSQFQKIQENIKFNPEFKKKVELENYINKVNNKCGIHPLEDNSDSQLNQYINKTNKHILMLEQIFENRKAKGIKRPIVKSQVMNQLLKAKAGQQFINDIRY
jgi:hypothetical protein